MSTQFQSILDAVLQLPKCERGELAALVLDSFDDEDLEESTKPNVRRNSSNASRMSEAENRRRYHGKRSARS